MEIQETPIPPSITLAGQQKRYLDKFSIYENLDLFVHQSGIKIDGFRSLRNGESVEVGNDGRAKAANVTGLNGGSVQHSPRGSRGFRCYNCGEEGHFSRECPTSNR